MNEHELTKTTQGNDLGYGTFEYTCPACSQMRVYAEPTSPENVYCNGVDFGTKVEVNGAFIEVSEYTLLNSISNSGDSTVGEIPENVDIEKLQELGFVEVSDDGFRLPEQVYNKDIWQS